MARVRRRGHAAVLCPPHARCGLRQVEPAKDHHRRHRLAIPERAQTRAEDMNLRTAVLVALALLVVSTSLAAHEAAGDKRLPVIGPAPPFTLTSQDNAPMALADFRGKVGALTFIFTCCPDIC